MFTVFEAHPSSGSFVFNFAKTKTVRVYIQFVTIHRRIVIYKIAFLNYQQITLRIKRCRSTMIKFFAQVWLLFKNYAAVLKVHVSFKIKTSKSIYPMMYVLCSTFIRYKFELLIPHPNACSHKFCCHKHFNVSIKYSQEKEIVLWSLRVVPTGCATSAPHTLLPAFNSYKNFRLQSIFSCQTNSDLQLTSTVKFRCQDLTFKSNASTYLQKNIK